MILAKRQLDKIQVRYDDRCKPEPWMVWIPLVPINGYPLFDEDEVIPSPYGESYWPTWQTAWDFVKAVFA